MINSVIHLLHPPGCGEHIPGDFWDEAGYTLVRSLILCRACTMSNLRNANKPKLYVFTLWEKITDSTERTCKVNIHRLKAGNRILNPGQCNIFISISKRPT